MFDDNDGSDEDELELDFQSGEMVKKPKTVQKEREIHNDADEEDENEEEEDIDGFKDLTASASPYIRTIMKSFIETLELSETFSVSSQVENFYFIYISYFYKSCIQSLTSKWFKISWGVTVTAAYTNAVKYFIL